MPITATTLSQQSPPHAGGRRTRTEAGSTVHGLHHHPAAGERKPPRLAARESAFSLPSTCSGTALRGYLRRDIGDKPFPGLRRLTTVQINVSISPRPIPPQLGLAVCRICAAWPTATAPQATSPGCPGCRGPAWGLLLPLPQTPSLFCAFIRYSCDHLGAMPPLSFPDSAGISGSSPLHLPLQKAPGLCAALPPVFVRLSLPPRSLFPPLPAKVLPSQLSLVFIFSWLRRTVTSDSPLLFLRGLGKTRPTFAWCQLHSPGLLLLLPGGGGSCYRSVSPPFSSQLHCSWRDWSAQSWGPPRSCSMELDFPLPSPCPSSLKE